MSAHIPTFLQNDGVSSYSYIPKTQKTALSLILAQTALLFVTGLREESEE